jgi:hypothetical protein
MTGHVVVCGCTGRIEPIAYLDDDRASGDVLAIRAVRPWQKQSVIAAPPEIDGAPMAELFADGVIEAMWAEHQVSETVWRGGHSTYTIRCAGCGVQAQMSDAKYSAIADELATKRDEFAAVATDDGRRHVVPLGVLCHMVKHING